MSVNDVLKKSFLESALFSTELSADTFVSIVESLILSIALGIVIYFIYKKTYRGVIFSRSFAVSLVGMSVLTCAITLAISTNVVISLGMVGALSIVRYRTAIKDPMDLMFMFWSIGTGIILGAQAYFLVAATFVAVIIALLILNRKNVSQSLYIMILHYTGDDVSDEIKKILYGMKYQIKSKTLRGESFEMAVEVQVKNKNLSFVDRVKELPQIDSLTVVQYNGEYHG